MLSSFTFIVVHAEDNQSSQVAVIASVIAVVISVIVVIAVVVLVGLCIFLYRKKKRSAVHGEVVNLVNNLETFEIYLYLISLK